MEFELKKKNTKIGIVDEVISWKNLSDRFLFFLTRLVTPKLFIKCKAQRMQKQKNKLNAIFVAARLIG